MTAAGISFQNPLQCLKRSWMSAPGIPPSSHWRGRAHPVSPEVGLRHGCLRRCRRPAFPRPQRAAQPQLPRKRHGPPSAARSSRLVDGNDDGSRKVLWRAGTGRSPLGPSQGKQSRELAVALSRSALREQPPFSFREFVTGYMTHAPDSAVCRWRLSS